MGRLQYKILIYMLAAIVCISSTLIWTNPVSAGCELEYVQGEQPSGGLMLADAVIVRPLTLVASVAGAAIWVVSLPFTLLGGNTGEAGEILVTDPLCYTFSRPLGYMERLP